MLDHLLTVVAPTHHQSLVVERPPDATDAARLLHELEAEARDKVEGGIRLESNGLKCLMHVLHDAATDDRISVVRLELSGNKLEVRVVHSSVDRLRKTEREMVADVVEALARAIAGEVLSQLGPYMRPFMSGRS